MNFNNNSLNVLGLLRGFEFSPYRPIRNEFQYRERRRNPPRRPIDAEPARRKRLQPILRNAPTPCERPAIWMAAGSGSEFLRRLEILVSQNNRFNHDLNRSLGTFIIENLSLLMKN